MEEDKKPKKDSLFFKMFGRFSKIIVSITIIYSMILTTVSYIWSYLGKDPLVDLSTTIISTLVAPVITYLVTNTVQVCLEYNKTLFSTPLALLNQETSSSSENPIEDVNSSNEANFAENK